VKNKHTAVQGTDLNGVASFHPFLFICFKDQDEEV
jgi:hypothetical protein